MCYVMSVLFIRQVFNFTRKVRYANHLVFVRNLNVIVDGMNLICGLHTFLTIQFYLGFYLIGE